MNISGLFIRRPVGTTLLALALSFSGILAYRALPVSALPEVDFPTIVVQAFLPGASAETMATTVTTPLERQLGQTPAVRQLTSLSSFGSSQITLQFDMARSIDAAEQDVQAALNAASNLLPKTLPTPPTYSKSNPADAPIMTLAVASETLPLSQVHDFADSVLAQKLSQLPGVGLVTLAGSQKPAVRIRADTDALANMGLTLEDIRTALASANVNAPKGALEGPRQSWAISTDDQLSEASSFKRLIIAYQNDAPVRLENVAEVVDGVENEHLAAWADHHPAILLNVQRQPGVNILAVAADVRTLVTSLAPTVPKGMHIEIMADRTITTKASIDDVEWTLVLTTLLVIMVIYLFLGDWRATLIPAVCVPLSILGTFIFMYLCGLGLDNLSLMALTISTGFVVDDAIVMVENIARFIESGLSPQKAALTGAKEIGFTIVSLTVSLIAVLIPLLFMGGTIGRLFAAFSLVLAAAIVTSAILSLTLTPMMCAQLLVGKDEVRQDKSGVWDAVEKAYKHSLGHVLRWPKTTLLVTAVTAGMSVAAAVFIPKGFFPEADSGQLLGITQAGQDVSFLQMSKLQQRVARMVESDPDVAHVASFIGSDGTNPTPNVGRLAITLQPFERRQSDHHTIMRRLREKIEASVDGMTLFLQPTQELQLDSRQGRTQYQYVLGASDHGLLDAWVPRLAEAFQQSPQLRDVAHDQGVMGQTAHLVIDRDTAARFGVTPQLIDDTLYDAFGQRFVSTTFTQLNQYRIILEVPRHSAQSFEDILALRLPVANVGQEPVRLGTVVRLEAGQKPLSISHQGQFPSATLSFNLAPQTSLGQATQAIEEAGRKIGLPDAIRAEFAGAAQAFGEALEKEPPLILAALLVVYVVLGVLYESFIHPLTILSTLPSAGLGALVALFLWGLDFNIMGLIGVILLIGIVKKNAIMMIDFALVAQRSGEPIKQAIFSACLLRFRPIMMTSMAALLGAIPLALSRGPGAEMRTPLGISIVGGLVVSQVLTLYTTPVIYLAMHRVGLILKRGMSRG